MFNYQLIEMNFIQRAFIKWLVPQISSHMRCPQGGLFGAIAMHLMKKFNVRSIREGIHRLKLNSTDTFVEIGAGNGDGLTALLNSVIPNRVVLIEISERFINELNKIILQHQAASNSTLCIEVYSQDCKSMPFLKDESVNKIFGMNVVYFLSPLEQYLKEIKRVLKPGGRVVFGCKFGSLPKVGATVEFVNANRHEICSALRRQGFDVSTNKVLVDGGDNEMMNYLEIVGVKACSVADWEKNNLLAVMESSQ
jgi:ubiquinone/menaquinone biosynthesis C-methylase UbiE